MKQKNISIIASWLIAGAACAADPSASDLNSRDQIVALANLSKQGAAAEAKEVAGKISDRSLKELAMLTAELIERHDGLLLEYAATPKQERNRAALDRAVEEVAKARVALAGWH